MSWSASYMGRPEKVAEALERHSEAQKLTGQCRDEYEAAKPHLVGLVKRIFAEEGFGYTAPLVKINASGSGSSRDGKEIQSSLSVSIDPVWTSLV